MPRRRHPRGCNGTAGGTGRDHGQRSGGVRMAEGQTCGGVRRVDLRGQWASGFHSGVVHRGREQGELDVSGERADQICGLTGLEGLQGDQWRSRPSGHGLSWSHPLNRTLEECEEPRPKWVFGEGWPPSVGSSCLPTCCGRSHPGSEQPCITG